MKNKLHTDIKCREAALRPLAIFCFSYYILTCAVRYVGGTAKISIAAAFAAAFVVLTAVRAARGRLSPSRRLYIRAFCALCLGAALASAVSFAAFEVYLAGLEEKYCGEEAEVVALVEEVSYSGSYYGSYIVKTSGINGENVSVRLYLDAEPGLEAGNVIMTAADIAAVDKSGGISGEGEILFSDGIRLVAEGSGTKIIEYSRITPRIFMSRLNRHLANVLCDPRAGENSGIAAALFLGNKSRLQPSVTRDFRRLGISHVLALSGMHLAVICGAVTSLAKRLGARHRRIVCAAVTVCYVVLTGASPSVCRAGIMLLVMFSANLAGRGADSFTDLGIAVLLLSATDPFSAGGISLQLSAAAVFAILLQTRRVHKPDEEEKQRGWVSKLLWNFREAVKITVSVVMFTLPLTWLYFGYVAVVSPVTSFIFSALATVVLYLSPIALAAAPLAHLSGAVFRLLGALCSFIASLAAEISSLHGIVIPLSGTLMLVMCILCSAAFVLFCITNGKRRKFFAAAAAAVLVITLSVGALTNSRGGAVVVNAVNNKSSDELVVSSEGKVMVIDIGNGYKTSISKALCSTETEVIMLTHSHNGYPSSLADIFDRNIVRCLLVPDDFDENMLSRLADVCRQKNVIFELYHPGGTVYFGDAEIKTYEKLYLKRSSQPVVRIDVSAFGESFTYLGAAYTEACENIDIDPASTVWFGCHGPKYKNDSALPADFSGEVLAAGTAADFAPSGAAELHSVVLRSSGKKTGAQNTQNVYGKPALRRFF